TVNISNHSGSYTDAYLKPNYPADQHQTDPGTNSFEVRHFTGGTFQLSSVVAQEFTGSHIFSSVRVVGYVSGGGTVASTAITSDNTAANHFTFSGGNMSQFVGVNLTKFRLEFVNAGGSHIGYLGLKSFDTEPADSTGPTISAISNQNIAVGGNTGAL